MFQVMCTMVMYNVHIQWSCTMVMYNGHVQWSYTMVIYNGHVLMYDTCKMNVRQTLRVTNQITLRECSRIEYSSDVSNHMTPECSRTPYITQESLT